MRGGFVQPFNLALSKSYPDIFDALKNKPYNTVDGVSTASHTDAARTC